MVGEGDPGGAGGRFLGSVKIILASIMNIFYWHINIFLFTRSMSEERVFNLFYVVVVN